MSRESGHRIILTGPPGIGKTTVVKKVCSLLSQSKLPVYGFYTEEVRKNGYRVGFDVVGLDGTRGRLARSEDSGETLSELQWKVGKYVVLLKEFESIQARVFEKAIGQENGVLIIDEIGKMEMLSKQFQNNVTKIFDSNLTIIATIPIAKGKPIALVENIRNNQRHTLISVDNNNRNSAPSTIAQTIIKLLIE